MMLVIENVKNKYSIPYDCGTKVHKKITIEK